MSARQRDGGGDEAISGRFPPTFIRVRLIKFGMLRLGLDRASENRDLHSDDGTQGRNRTAPPPPHPATGVRKLWYTKWCGVDGGWAESHLLSFATTTTNGERCWCDFTAMR